VTDGIVAEAEKQKIKPKDEEELQKTLPYLRLQLKALVARDLWETSQYFAIMNEANDIVCRALELMNP
jgi:carboxyl-terminal processing protease